MKDSGGRWKRLLFRLEENLKESVWKWIRREM
jgi:hypothetical protein